jgi:hypothetical protein
MSPTCIQNRSGGCGKQNTITTQISALKSQDTVYSSTLKPRRVEGNIVLSPGNKQILVTTLGSEEYAFPGFINSQRTSGLQQDGPNEVSRIPVMAVQVPKS